MPDKANEPETMGAQGASANGGLNRRALALLALHVLLLVYSFTSFFSKNAAQQEFLSPQFIGLYLGMVAVLGIYAVGWQQVIKHLPLTLAFANKAVTVVWGIVWGIIFFGETVTPLMAIGAAIAMVGVVLFGIADAREQRDAAGEGAGSGEETFAGDSAGAAGRQDAAGSIPGGSEAHDALEPRGKGDGPGQRDGDAPC